MGWKHLRLPPEEYQKLIRQVFERDKWACIVCKLRQNLHAHHVIFRSQGGTDTIENMCTLCVDCHSSVHSNDLVIQANKTGFKWFPKNGWKPLHNVRKR